jgi:hypothetical protein
MQLNDTNGVIAVGEIGLERQVRRHGFEIRQYLETLLAKRSIRHAHAAG